MGSIVYLVGAVVIITVVMLKLLGLYWAGPQRTRSTNA